MGQKEIVKVKVKSGTSRGIAKLFGVSEIYVSMCCNGKRNGETAKKIRMAAVNAGGDPIYKNN